MAIRVGELNRRSHAPDPPDRPVSPTAPEARAEAARSDRTTKPDRAEPTARPDVNGRSATPEQRQMLDRLTGTAPRSGRPAAPDTRPLTDPGTAKAEITELKARRDTDKAEFADQKAPDRPEHAAALDAAHARIAELEKQVSALESDKTEVKSQLDAANTKIADQGKQLGTQGHAISDLQERMQRLEDAGPDEHRASSDGVDRRGSTDRPERNTPGGDNGADRVADRLIGEDAQLADKQKPNWLQRGPRDATLGFASSTAGLVLGGISEFMPPGPASAATFAGSLLGWTVAGLSWMRDRRKKSNADRSEG